MPFIVGNKRLVPAPVVNIQRQATFAQDGQVINTNYTITLNGTILPNRGSPLSYGWHYEDYAPPTESWSTDDDKFASILSKQALLRAAFAATGYKVQYSAPGYPAVEFYPRFNGISFNESSWVIKSDYVVNLETPQLSYDSTLDEFVGSSGYSQFGLTAIADDFSVRSRDDNVNVLEVTRACSATASFNYLLPSGQEPWRNARAWVLNRLATVPLNSGLALSLTTYGTSILSSTGYNLVEEETINKHTGTYSRNQRYIFNSTNYLETRTISRTYTPAALADGAGDVETITVNGTIVGYSPVNSGSLKLNAARAYYSGIVGGIASSVGAYGRSVNNSINEDVNQGTVQYSLSYINHTGSLYKHVYDVSLNFSESALPTVTINGNFEGITPDQLYYGTGFYNKFDMALTGWNQINPTLKSLAFATTLIPSGSVYNNTPTTKSISFNKPNGTINYSQTFSYLPSGLATDLFRNEYSVEFSTDNALSSVGSQTRPGSFITATVNGTVYGVSPNSDPNERLSNARAGWDSIDGNLYTFATNYYSVIAASGNPLAQNMLTRSVSVNTTQGIITYSARFNNQPTPTSTGVAIEDVVVDDTAANDIFAVQIIPGRSVGPIIQNVGTTNERKKSIQISLTLFPKYPTGYYTYADKTIPATIASGIISGIVSTVGTRGTNWFLAGDSENWNYKNAFYTRNFNIVY